MEWRVLKGHLPCQVLRYICLFPFLFFSHVRRQGTSEVVTWSCGVVVGGRGVAVVDITGGIKNMWKWTPPSTCVFPLRTTRVWKGLIKPNLNQVRRRVKSTPLIIFLRRLSGCVGMVSKRKHLYALSSSSSSILLSCERARPACWNVDTIIQIVVSKGRIMTYAYTSSHLTFGI